MGLHPIHIIRESHTNKQIKYSNMGEIVYVCQLDTYNMNL